MSILSEKAILVRFSVAQWTARKFDKKATAEVEQNHGANANAGEVGRFNKQLASKRYMTELSSNISLARAWHYEQTLPWHDAEGVRILPVANFNKYLINKLAYVVVCIDAGVYRCVKVRSCWN